ncbi:dolichol monophosphate mannose synthase [Salmonella enterica]|uniref:FaeA/PapI family transcriptional regulator n=1 Tax=Salmonella enterica TaxID=28901 RepID=UPI0011192A6F|nr:FaeA/PapI family transcriptional regulator [Salmonella enterica]ECF7044178.1 dolichol monophosphate mannose synthase [Salmonella enterica subsp. enterica]EBD0851657.1 dolichol monophosphate mannose synthase [Salmonella enterica]EBF2435110.1 dolichol monophosphate mannose synthase [Salmonella enterica]EBN7034253.1 dolichol monophosphate mannose synthase [Salmonella enterica]ECE2168173.1 dolichol monophosphate mannose synthase [Salmonella enterica]
MKEKILAHMCANKDKKTWTTQEIVSFFGISSYQARHYLTQLLNQKILIRSPFIRGASTYWMLSGQETDVDIAPADKQK